LITWRSFTIKDRVNDRATIAVAAALAVLSAAVMITALFW
jgi:hypothetical protein